MRMNRECQKVNICTKSLFTGIKLFYGILFLMLFWFF